MALFIRWSKTTYSNSPSLTYANRNNSFDEATSALDNETQEQIQKAIDNLKGEYTILIIAHRLSTVIDADKIFVIDDGKIIDSGTHQELLKKCEFYKNLYSKDLHN